MDSEKGEAGGSKNISQEIERVIGDLIELCIFDVRKKYNLPQTPSERFRAPRKKFVISSDADVEDPEAFLYKVTITTSLHAAAVAWELNESFIKDRAKSISKKDADWNPLDFFWRLLKKPALESKADSEREGRTKWEFFGFIKESSIPIDAVKSINELKNLKPEVSATKKGDIFLKLKTGIPYAAVFGLMFDNDRRFELVAIETTTIQLQDLSLVGEISVLKQRLRELLDSQPERSAQVPASDELDEKYIKHLNAANYMVKFAAGLKESGLSDEAIRKLVEDFEEDVIRIKIDH